MQHSNILSLRKLQTLKPSLEEPRHFATGTDPIRSRVNRSCNSTTLLYPLASSFTARLFFISKRKVEPLPLSGNSLFSTVSQFPIDSFPFFPSSCSRAITMQLPFMEPTLHSSVSFPIPLKCLPSLSLSGLVYLALFP